MQARTNGFTMVELLLSVGIISMLAGLSLPLYASFYNRTNLDTATDQVAHALRRAQTFSRAANGDTTWGVRVQSGSAVVFKGATYAARDATYDEIISLNNITPTGLSEVVFTKLYGVPSTTGTITLTETTINESKAIELNVKGLVTY